MSANKSLNASATWVDVGNLAQHQKTPLFSKISAVESPQKAGRAQWLREEEEEEDSTLRMVRNKGWNCGSKAIYYMYSIVMGIRISDTAPKHTTR